MKKIFILFLFVSFKMSAQSNQLITLINSALGFSLQYPGEWDSTTFSPFKTRFKVDFGVMIKANFNENKTGGFFTITNAEGWGSDLKVAIRESEASFQNAYPDGKIISSKQEISKNKVPYHLFITEVQQFGISRIITQIQVLKNNNAVILGFTSPKPGYEKLRPYFERVVDSFKFDTP